MPALPDSLDFSSASTVRAPGYGLKVGGARLRANDNQPGQGQAAEWLRGLHKLAEAAGISSTCSGVRLQAAASRPSARPSAECADSTPQPRVQDSLLSTAGRTTDDGAVTEGAAAAGGEVQASGKKNAVLAEFLGVPAEKQIVTNMLVAHTAQFTYAVGHEISLIMTPFINAAAHGDISSYSLYRSLHNLVQVVGGIAFGRFADSYGPRLSMLTAHTATLVYYVVLSRAASQQMLFLSLLPCAAMHGFQAAQIVACSSSTPDKRAQVFGHVGVAYGSGFVSGTALVACLGQSLQPHTVMATAAAFEVAMIGVIAWQLREQPLLLAAAEPEAEPDTGAALNASGDERCGIAAADEQKLGIGLVAAARAHLTDLMATPGVFRLLAAKLGISTAAGLTVGMAPQFAMDPFGLTSAQAGLMMGYISAVQLISTAATGRLVIAVREMEAVRSGHLPETAMLVAIGGSIMLVSMLGIAVPGLLAHSALSLTGTSAATTGSTFSLVGLKQAAGMHSFAFWLGPLAGAQQVLLVALTAELTARVPPQDLGFMLGVDNATCSASGVVAPLLAGWLVQQRGFIAVPVVGAAVISGTTAGVLRTFSCGMVRTDGSKDESAEVINEVEPERDV